MKKILCGMFLIFGFTGSAVATVLTFDELGLGAINGYGGFTWNADNPIYALDSTPPVYNGTGYRTGTVSGTNVAYNGRGLTPTSVSLATGTFDFNGAYWTSALDATNTLSFEGWNDGKLVYSSLSHTISKQQPTWIDLNWFGIQRLVIRNSGSQWAMDNFTFNEKVSAVPLPMAAWLYGSALIGAGVASRRRKRYHSDSVAA